MFSRLVKDVLRKLEISEKEYNFIVSRYGNYTCKLKSLGANLDYYDLYERSKKCYTLFVFQGLTEKTVLDMNPFEDAIVISQNLCSNKCQIHRFHPWAFTKVIVLKSREDIVPNFEKYRVLRADGSIVSHFEELGSREEFFAISKQTFCGQTPDGCFPYHHPIHMILRWEPTFIRFD